MLIGKSDGQNLIDFLMKYGGTPSIKTTKSNDEDEGEEGKGGNDIEPDDLLPEPKKEPNPISPQD